jgi:hypothetical protein
MNNGNKAEAKWGGANCTEDKMTNDNDNDLFKKYIHDIRNMKVLNKEMINNIRIMSNEKKMDIIIALNDIVEYLNSVIE